MFIISIFPTSPPQATLTPKPHAGRILFQFHDMEMLVQVRPFNLAKNALIAFFTNPRSLHSENAAVARAAALAYKPEATPTEDLCDLVVATTTSPHGMVAFFSFPVLCVTG